MKSPSPSVPLHWPLAIPTVLFLALAGVTAGILSVFASLDGGAAALLHDPRGWLAGVDAAEAADTLSNAAEVVAAVLAVAMTVVAIVVELAATRYSHEITRLFLREPINLIVLGLFTVTTLLCVWTIAVVDEPAAGHAPGHAGFVVTLGMVTLCLLLLLPYIYYVFTFLSPISVIQRICRDAYRVILRTRHGNLEVSQQRVEAAVDELQDVARSALVQGDRSIAMAAVDALAGLLGDYVRVRARLPERWFDISDSIAADPDFIALAPETMAEVRAQGIWLERKIMRRYLSLMGQSAGHSRDVGNLIGIHTRQLACEFGADHPHLLELFLRTFNSFLRATINARDPRTAYFLMNQYRLIGEHLLQQDSQAAVVAVAGYLREYGQVAHKGGLSFLLETAAHDVALLIEEALDQGSAVVDVLLDCLLEFDQEIKEESQEESLLGIRRTQMQLGAILLLRGERDRAQRIADDLTTERPERLERLHRAMLQEERADFWELMDRGVNFAYLRPEARPYLSSLLAMTKSSSKNDVTDGRM
jgi:hypothetical protein